MKLKIILDPKNGDRVVNAETNEVVENVQSMQIESFPGGVQHVTFVCSGICIDSINAGWSRQTGFLMKDGLKHE